jgi:N,N'-diacetyllegionaminate synthase
MSFRVGNVLIGGSQTVVIAEAGVNHLRDMSIAENLIKTAARAGADIVKFQTYSANTLTTKNAPRFWSWGGEHDDSGSQHDSYSILETPDEDFTFNLIKLCKKYDVEFMSTPFDNASVEMLNSLNCPAFKIASGDITNFPLLRKVASTNKPIFLSTGASSLSEISAAVAEINNINAQADICIMHCTLCYPTRSKDANLSAISDIVANFSQYVIGLSDHTIGPVIPAASILYGVKVIEKHYTYDKKLPDSADHWLSIDEDGLGNLVKMLRQLEPAIGNGQKSLLNCEEIARSNARRSLVASGTIKKGEKFSYTNVIPKRPGYGISPVNIDELVGLTAQCDIEDDVIIVAEHIVEDASFKPINETLLKLVGDDV